MNGAAEPVPAPGGGAGPRLRNRTARLLPTQREPGTAISRYFRQSYHPSQEGSLRRAVEYLAASPAARAAAAAGGRAAMS
ncbi:hypothetical protein [Streptomyces sp. NBC_00161]|uniref:hypothetical protein n=1 Tax=Streptomyces sp. NBC_00161 TaxID=2975671 RepID=UPI003866A5EF